MKAFWLLAILILAGCGGNDQPAGQAGTSIPEGSCLQVEVAVGEGFRVDGQTVPAGEVGPALDRALATGSRIATVDVSCAADAPLAALDTLHSIMRERDLHRIQYFREPDPPIPYSLPSAGMDERLAELPEADRCEIDLASDGRATLAGTEFTGDAVKARLAANPGVIFVLRAPKSARYADFVRVLGAVTGAGAQRVAVRIVSG